MHELHAFNHDGLRLAYRDTAPGDSTRPTVVLLHGFPDHSGMWSAQISHLHERGYRVIAPDLRGYGASDIAPRTSDYRASTVVGDVIALADHLGIRQFDLVGHDWGAALAWVLAGDHPTRVNKLVTISVGHPTAYGRAGWRQKLKGWYTLFFQIRWLAERLLLGRGPLRLQRVFASHPHMDEAMQHMRRPGRMRAAISLYRANFRRVLFGKFARVSAPTLGIYSRGDRFLTEDQMRNSARYVDGPFEMVTLDGGHWIPFEQPGVLNDLLDRFLDEPQRSARATN